MISGHDVSTSCSAAEGRNRKLLTAGISILSGIVLVCIFGYIALRHSDVTPLKAPAAKPVAELVRASGMVLVQNPGKSEWREVNMGTHLMEGALVRTDSSGEASIQYRSGTSVTIPAKTVFTVRGGGNGARITISPEEANRRPSFLPQNKGAQETRTSPSIELHKIVPFGRSLELVGRVEAGSKLLINDESADVTGDGSFRHFTSPFPPSANLVRINLKVTDLAGRSRIWTATHDFSPHGEEN